MTYYARSASPSAPNQPYSEHVTNVSENAARFWAEASRYWGGNEGGGEAVAGIVQSAAEFHDLGKLDDGNQKVLQGSNPKAHLPVPHQDAGVAHLLAQQKILSSLLVYAHHIGLPDLSEVQLQKSPLRVADANTRQKVDGILSELLLRHAECGFAATPVGSDKVLHAAFDCRICLSCLADADHGDAAHASGETRILPVSPQLRPADRLRTLKKYIADLPASSSVEERRRNEVRTKFFNACLDSPTDLALTECDAPVGTGKTTAVMAHLLRVAEKHGLRRIFIILPFTNIIRQSVKVYRTALALPDEDPVEVVAEIHHRADYTDGESRRLTALWNAPIVVTTAVAFFETLASNQPATLRRLHNLPGAAVFLDEAHAMLPTKLLPLAWHWINHTARDWTCFWTLASGSLNRFWQFTEFDPFKSMKVTNILSPETQSVLATAEKVRVAYRRQEEPFSLETLIDWLTTLDGPVLVVLNTVHSAAAAARRAAERFGLESVFHLSTALAPQDRDAALDRVIAKLKDEGSRNWFLFATSCVEAGVDLSFRTGVREAASLASLLQLAGRINRNATVTSGDVWTISLETTGPDVVANPAWSVSARVLSDLFAGGNSISPSLCTEAMKRELRESGISSELETLRKAEDIRSFMTVEKGFRVIQDDSVAAVVDTGLVERIERFDEVSWRDIQKGSVRVRRKIIEKVAVQESRRYPGVYLWKAEYSPFLGYMEAVLNLENFGRDGYAIF